MSVPDTSRSSSSASAPLLQPPAAVGLYFFFSSFLPLIIIIFLSGELKEKTIASPQHPPFFLLPSAGAWSDYINLVYCVTTPAVQRVCVRASVWIVTR